MGLYLFFGFLNGLILRSGEVRCLNKHDHQEREDDCSFFLPGGFRV